MDTLRHVEFYSNGISLKPDKYNYLYNIQSYERKVPHIDKVIELSEGYIHFNGEYTVKNDELPMGIFMSTYLIENKSYEDEASRKNYRSNGRILEKKFYEVEIYSIEHVSSDEHKIYFKTIHTFDTLKGFLQKITKINDSPNLHRRGGE